MKDSINLKSYMMTKHHVFTSKKTNHLFTMKIMLNHLVKYKINYKVIWQHQDPRCKIINIMVQIVSVSFVIIRRNKTGESSYFRHRVIGLIKRRRPNRIMESRIMFKRKSKNSMMNLRNFTINKWCKVKSQLN